MAFVQSPLNYTGGKAKLLPQILPLFPKRINTFVDLFCGGCNVGVNAVASKVIYNDLDRNLIYLYHTLKNLDKQAVFNWVYEIIDKYGLSLVSLHGYEHYGCDSSSGLGDYNREKFLKLREDFNIKLAKDYYYYVVLYVLIVYAFNNQIRFNANQHFNLPVGKRDFNSKMAEKLSSFIDKLHEQDCEFTCQDFRDFDVESLNVDDFVYVDPPYLITCATYNEQGGWDLRAEQDLLNFLDKLNAKGIKFALSNVLRSKGKENKLLIQWLESNSSKYKAVRLNYNYANSSYHTKDRTKSSEEVLIINY
ncbi:MAG: Dam family site-specific DNA-(adenine-N6)-methyltransferase [Bacilli bacterium]|nr:Dam family site-specific DNA-(adenine-N6)-methyltransferase [Bacilli bacterium]MBR3782217.1 Dam family site-specific DNA-(adenine-N6)-methyltransferase [Alphaproteobacteria bacterium]